MVWYFLFMMYLQVNGMVYLQVNSMVYLQVNNMVHVYFIYDVIYR